MSKRVIEDSKAWYEIIFTSLKNGISPRVLSLESPAWADPTKNLAHRQVDEALDMDRVQRDLMGLVSWIVEGNWTLEKLVLKGVVGFEWLPGLYYYQSRDDDGTTDRRHGEEDEDHEQDSKRCCPRYEIHYASSMEIEEKIGKIRFKRDQDEHQDQDQDRSEVIVLGKHNIWDERKKTLERWLKEYELDVIANLPLPHQPERPDGRKLKASVNIINAGDMFHSTAGWTGWLGNVIEDEEIRHDLREKIVFC
ncbi:hypothetical protein I302_100086 [Kwoniella bestiolae CBS 10118]|uniref:Uncharacterized protein n=1 Tax=Kwoniella bestiolae CBS 10118 TaxID=1296100 RepID=A0A1B9G425_9TREE|nr:hypothetical protein I302_03458 [Kwoniella bestiolae CBS 10118]OCF25785.1 hypothetical protein I302_03458 [Kwoniella bestiolae CBS 10118]